MAGWLELLVDGPTGTGVSSWGGFEGLAYFGKPVFQSG